MEKTTLVVPISIVQKEFAAEFAVAKDMSLSKLVREAIAQYTGYDLEAENKNKIERRGRPSKYATDEERKEAIKERTRKRDELRKLLLENHMREQRKKDAAKLQASLDRKQKGVA